MTRIILFILVFGVIALAACGGSDSAGYVPMGVGQGQPTFLFLFTEN